MSLLLVRRCWALGLLLFGCVPLHAEGMQTIGTKDRLQFPQSISHRLLPTAQLISITSTPVETLAQRLDALVRPVAEQAAVGVCVRSLERGEELYAQNADAAFVPASNQKLLVAAAALDVLGPGSCFTTQLLVLGRRRGDALIGDLIVRGGGDPTLTTDGLATLADRVVDAGIRCVVGRVRGDDSFFDRQRRGAGWSWDDEPFYYAAPISGLTLNGNTVRVEVRPAARPGVPPQARLEPPGAPSTLRVRAVTAPAGETSTLRVTRTRARDEILITGRFPRDGEPITTRVTIEDPPLYAAAVFTALLRARGVRVTGEPIVMGTPAAAVPLGEIQSPPVSELVHAMNKTSDNLIAETLLKALGSSRSGLQSQNSAKGSPRPSIRAPEPGLGRSILRRFLERSGLRASSLAIADGSGLSRENLVSPRNLVRLLAAMDRHPARNTFFESLPVAGVDGTLRQRMVGSGAVGSVRAKTGTLTHVTALTGVATTWDGERLAFSILTNNFPRPLTGPDGPRSMEDALAAALTEFRR